MGYPPGNPWADNNWGGGTGCHWDGKKRIDQTSAVPPGQPTMNLADQSCQCNYNYKENWDMWVDTWILYGDNVNKDDGWFWGGKTKAPGHALDQAACWMNNPRDMINLQNHIYLRRFDWSNQEAPQSRWDRSNPASLRPYWGWNEIPVSRETISNKQLRDAVMIKLPAAICGDDGGRDSLSCLGKGQGENLEGDFDVWLSQGLMKLGVGALTDRPGSYFVIMREWMHSIPGWGVDNWSKWFFCENWVSPNGKYKIVFVPQGSSVFPYGACYVEKGYGWASGQTILV